MSAHLAILAFAATAAVLPAHAAGPLRLPDTEVTRAGPVVAYLTDPTGRYDHGVLGDAIEAGGFAIERDGGRLVYRLPEDAVFEDRRVRLADLDGDGAPEAIVVKSYLRRGAAIAVYALGPDRVEPLAESPPVGAPRRWLNLAGIADFTGGGETMIAAVVTPHLAGSLRLYRLAAGRLVEVARLDGYTNHIIGSRDLDLARTDDVDGDGVPDLVLPSLDRRALAAVGFRGNAAVEIRRVAAAGRIVTLDGVKDGMATVTLESGARRAIDLKGGRR